MRYDVASRVDLLGAEAAFLILGRAKELEAEGRDIVHLEIGEPDFDTPKHIKDAAAEALSRGETHYTPTPGIPELREAIADKTREDVGIDVEWSKSVIVTVGGKEAVFATMMALLDTGDEVLYPNPGYPAYESAGRCAGAKVIPLELREENGFRMSPDQVNELVGKKTKMIVTNSPENPCGSVLTEQDVKGIAEIAVDNGVYLLSDEIYKHITYGNVKHVSPAAEPDALGNTIIVDGFSKSYAMTGWRLGYVVAPEQVARPITKLLNIMTSCPNSFAQWGAVAALRGPMDPILEMVKTYDKRREVVVSEIGKIDGIHVLDPAGAFYAFINFKEVLEKTRMNSEEFAKSMLEHHGVALLHGSAMGRFGEGYIRLSFANSVDNIRKGLARVASAVDEALSG